MNKLLELINAVKAASKYNEVSQNISNYILTAVNK